MIRFSASEPGASTFLDLTAPTLLSATLNGQPVDDFDGNRLQLPGLAADNELVVEAEMAYMRTGEGLHRFVDPVDGGVYLYSQFETFDAHRVYGCFDQPDLKAPFRFTIRAPRDWEVISNGAVVDRPAGGEPGTWRFAETPRMSTYITAVVAGPYHCVRDTHDGIDLGIYCRGSLAEFLDADELFLITKQGFDFYHRVFDYRYPFGKYDQLFVPEFNAGAMENAAAVTFLEDYVFRSKVTDASYERRAETVLHEMAHMWFGDLVTMRWWDDLWLNESFATYMSVLCQVEATSFTGGWTTFANTEKTWAYRQDQLPSTHPIAADIPDMEAVNVNFDGITYAKGASVLKQLVAWVGQDAFLGALRTYFVTHEFGNTELRDLLVQLERTSGRELSSWTTEWLQTAGVNTLRAEFETGPDGAFTAFSVLQEAPTDWPTLRSHRVAIGCYDLRDGKLVRTHREELDVVGREDRRASAGRTAASPPWSWSTTTTSPSRRSGSTSPSLATLARACRRLRRIAAEGAVLGRGLGHDPRRRDAGPRLRRPGAARHRRRERHRRRAVPPAAGAGGSDAVRRPGVGSHRPSLARHLRLGGGPHR